MSGCATTQIEEPEIKPEPTPSDKIHKNSDLSFDAHQYDYDIVSGATSTTFGTTPPPLYTDEEKANLMFWSNQPPLGVLEGYYYKNERSFSGSNYGIVEVVTNPQTKQIENVQFTEFASNPYYENKYSGKNKRLSDYAFFQAANTRTDETLVTVVNGITFVEDQMRAENRLSGSFNTVKGASSSARQGFMPLASEMSGWLDESFGYKYFGVAKELDNGIIARLEVITKDDVIEEVKYDEYFADSYDKMTDITDRPYYRQSRYYSIDYNLATNNEFIDFADSLTNYIEANNSLIVDDESFTKHEAFETYKTLAEMLDIKPSW
ncbi:hypothetical protein G7062_10325 [Erysipelothrix sp. HDW6C]|nr:hypothetical protein G7062_10325 [Erysipelothrix sp. HDW6C]